MTTNYIGHNKVLLSSFGEEGKDTCFQAGKIIPLHLSCLVALL